MVVRGAYTISSFMEGTGTNLRLPLNPPFDSEYQALYNTPRLSGCRPRACPGPRRPESERSVHGRDHPPVGSRTCGPAKSQQWNFTIEFQLP